MEAQHLTEAAVAALARGDITAYLAYVAEEVVVQLNENPPQHGKVAYRQMLEALHTCGETLTGFVVAGVAATTDGAVAVRVLGTPMPADRLLQGIVTGSDGETVIRVDEEHQVSVTIPGGQLVTRRATLPSFYTVQGDRITKVRAAALAAGRRAYRYP